MHTHAFLKVWGGGLIFYLLNTKQFSIIRKYESTNDMF